MTTQIQDRFNYQNAEYVLLGVSGDTLPSPQDFGMAPSPMSTACYRGYHNQYSCIDDFLVLVSMRLCLADHAYQAIDGVYPTPVFLMKDGSEVALSQTDGIEYFKKCRDVSEYLGLSLNISFSGGLLIGKDFMKEMGVIDCPVSYKTVIELLFDNGRLMQVTDQSEVVAKNRENPTQPAWEKPGIFRLSMDYDCYYA